MSDKNNTNVVQLHSEDDSVQRLIESAKEEGCDSLFVVGLKEGTIFYGSSNYPSTLYTLGCLDIVKEHVMKGSYEE